MCLRLIIFVIIVYFSTFCYCQKNNYNGNHNNNNENHNNHNENHNNNYNNFDCDIHCSGDYTDKNFRPQECSVNCPMRKELASIKALLIALITLVAVNLLVSTARLCKDLPISRVWHKVRNRCKNSQALEEGFKNTVSVDMAKTVKLNDYEQPTLECVDGPCMTSSVRSSCGTKPRKSPPLQTSSGRRSASSRPRVPSESVCLDNDQMELSAYDNLAMSSSTISVHSRPSSPPSPTSPITSINTVTTTLSVSADPIDNGHGRGTAL